MRSAGPRKCALFESLRHLPLSVTDSQHTHNDPPKHATTQQYMYAVCAPGPGFQYDIANKYKQPAFVCKTKNQCHISYAGDMAIL